MTMISLNQTMAILTRDLRLSIRSGGGWFHALLFFGLVAGLSGLLFGPELSTLSRAAPAVVWLAAALAVQFAVVDIFHGDLAEGFLHSVAAEEGNFLFVLYREGFVGARHGRRAACARHARRSWNVRRWRRRDWRGGGASPDRCASAHLACGVHKRGGDGATLRRHVGHGGCGAVSRAPVLIFGALAVKAAWAGGVLWTPEALILAALTLALTA